MTESSPPRSVSPDSEAKEEREFFVGYAPTPLGLGKWLRRLTPFLIVAAAAVVGLIAVFQRPLPAGTFEFGVQRRFEGVLYETPLPTLRVTEAAERGTAVRNLVLVGAGKWGLPDFARGHGGQKVRFEGSLIYRERMTMVELNDPESFEVVGEPEAWERRGRFDRVGEVTLEGEIVDTKCFFGVMRPATGKVHRACAIRCLSGGVPPGLLVRGEDGNDVVFMLAGQTGEELDLDIQWAALMVRVRGVVELDNDTPVLRVTSMELIES